MMAWQADGQGFEVLGVLVVEAEVELHLALAAHLGLLEVGEGPVDAVLPAFVEVLGDHHVHVEGQHLLLGAGGADGIVVAAGGEEDGREEAYEECCFRCHVSSVYRSGGVGVDGAPMCPIR